MLNDNQLGQKSGKGFYLYPRETGTPDITGKFAEIEVYLRNTWLSAARRFTMMSKLPIGEMNEAIREYFGLERGPFERV
jgi:3-hydroxyacyl-CoA dehydrogenase